MAEEVVSQRGCQAVLDKHRKELAKLAREKLKEGYQTEGFTLVCIDCSDPEWSKVIDHLMTNLLCDLVDEDGKPTVMGAVALGEATLTFRKILPQITKIMNAPRMDGAIRVIVFDGKVAAIFMERLTGEDLPN